MRLAAVPTSASTYDTQARAHCAGEANNKRQFTNKLTTLERHTRCSMSMLAWHSLPPRPFRLCAAALRIFTKYSADQRVSSISSINITSIVDNTHSRTHTPISSTHSPHVFRLQKYWSDSEYTHTRTRDGHVLSGAERSGAERPPAKHSRHIFAGVNLLI